MLTVKRLVGHTGDVARNLPALTAAWLDTLTSHNSRRAYGSDLSAFAAWCTADGTDPLDIVAADLDRYRDDSLAHGATPATVARRLSAIASFYRYVTTVGARADNPAGSTQRPRPASRGATALDGVELDALFGAAARLGPKTAALVALLARDGLKLNEALAVDIPDLRLGDDPAVGVARAGSTERVPLTAASAALVAAYVARRRGGPLFVGDGGGADAPATRLTRFGADYLLKRAGTAAQIDKSVSANVLRRSYVGAAHRSGTPLPEIARHLGHRETRDTARLLS